MHKKLILIIIALKYFVKQIIRQMDRLPQKYQILIRTKPFTDKICLFNGYWNVSDCNENPKSLFLYGDNDQKKGRGGQAIIRDCVNTFGIPTKKFPSNKLNAFYSDDEYDENCKKITQAIIDMITKSEKYEEIIFPSDGFGTGLAKLSTKAPNTFVFLQDMINKCFGIDYQDISKNGITLSATDPKAQELANACNMASAFKK